MNSAKFTQQRKQITPNRVFLGQVYCQTRRGIRGR